MSRGKHRLRRVARKVNRAHRAKLAAHRPQLRKNGRKSAKPGMRYKPAARASRKSRVYGAWPRRGVKAQRRAENIARVRAFTPAR